MLPCNVEEAEGEKCEDKEGRVLKTTRNYNAPPTNDSLKFRYVSADTPIRCCFYMETASLTQRFKSTDAPHPKKNSLRLGLQIRKDSPKKDLQKDKVLVLGVSETGSAKKGSAIDVRIDDAGSILTFRIGFSP